MKMLLSITLLLAVHTAWSQADSLEAMAGIQKFQRELNGSYQNQKTSPLTAQARKNFKSLPFFPIDLRFRVVAILTESPGSGFFEIPTTTIQKQLYRVYGYLTFSIDGQSFKLPVYQSKDLMTVEKYTDYLFLPFTDNTNGKTTYTGGRYIGLSIPKKGNEIVVDFNEAYNPYCAYSDRYSCPLVPKENHLDTEIRAGVMYGK